MREERDTREGWDKKAKEGMGRTMRAGILPGNTHTALFPLSEAERGNGPNKEGGGKQREGRGRGEWMDPTGRQKEGKRWGVGWQTEENSSDLPRRKSEL